MDQNTGGPVLEPTQEDKTQAMLCWLLSIIIGFISPIIFMLVGKDKPFVYANAMQCLTMMLVLWVVLMIVTVVTCGIGAVLFIIPLIFSIMGAMAAKDGKVYEPPVTGPLAKKWFNV
jgi:uncharacterized protein